VQRDYAQAIELLGDVRAKQRATLAAEVSGKVVKVAHRVGETAPKGQALIQIDPASYSAQLAAAQASLETARQQYLEATSGPRRETIAAQESAVAAAQARYDAAKDTLDRQQQLYAEGVVSESALVAAQSGADAAQAALKQEQQRLNELNAGTRTEEVKAAQARVDAAISAVKLAQLSLKRTTVAPPFEALVSQLMVEVGQYVGPGTPLAEVVALKSGSKVDNEAWFNLPEAQARRVQPGGMVELRADALARPGETPPVIRGKVASVAPAADPITRQFPVRVWLDDARLRPGMTVRGRILLGTPKATLMVPQDATTQTSLGLAVYRMTPPAKEGELPSVEPVTVTIGENVDKYIVVLTGEVKPGDMLVTRGKEQLYPTAHIIPTNLGQGGGSPGGGESAPSTGNPEPDDVKK
jgi:RND family efflux transporter MFP subunit